MNAPNARGGKLKRMIEGGALGLLAASVVVWQWLRTVYTAVLDFCKRGGAKAVVFDMLYTEPSSYGVDDDKALGYAIRRTPGFVGALFLSSQSGEVTNWPAGD